MKKFWAFALVACMAVCGLAGCAGGGSSSASGSADAASSSASVTESSSNGSASSTSTSTSTSADSASANSGTDVQQAQDVLTKHVAYLTDESADNYSEYVTVYYGSDSNSLVGYVDETHFAKAAGYTQESLESANYEEVFPNLNKLNFAKVTVTDEGDYYCVMVTFSHLNDAANVKAFIDSGIFAPDDGTDTSASFIDAKSVMSHLTANGATEVPATDQGKLHASIN